MDKELQDEADIILAEIKARKGATNAQKNTVKTTNSEETKTMATPSTIEQLKQAFEEAQAKKGTPAEDGTERTVRILVKDFSQNKKTAKSGSEYIQGVLEYRNIDYDKLEEKKFALFDAEQTEVILTLEIGHDYDITQVKRKGYWVWTGATDRTEA